MKLSKTAKMRIKRMSATEMKAVAKAAKLLADTECITPQRAATIMRTLKQCQSGY
tara:strand:- start:294 stop:458 length:165 start_codon:yes stop_codon:yes gene_type:complete